MSSENATPSAGETDAKKKSPLVPMLAAAIVGLVLGGAAGAFAVGPALAAAVTLPGDQLALAAGQATAAGAHGAKGAKGEKGGKEKKEKKEGEKEGEKSVYLLDNLVLNPNNSGGGRFLLVSVAFELGDAGQLERMKARDAEVRDVVVGALAVHSVEELADMAQREALKAALVKQVDALLGEEDAVQRVFFPQFVIQ